MGETVDVLVVGKYNSSDFYELHSSNCTLAQLATMGPAVAPEVSRLSYALFWMIDERPRMKIPSKP